MTDRVLRWDGLINGRDLGGIRTGSGHQIIARRLVRAASPHTLSAAGWQQLADYGVGTTIDLRHDWEIAENNDVTKRRPTAVGKVCYSLEPDGFIDRLRASGETWKLKTPLYYDEFVFNSPERVVAVLELVVDAPAGGVLVHCYAGRDRSGLAVAVLLDLLGVAHEQIIQDHWLSFSGDTTVEAAQGLQSLTQGELPLSQDRHSEIMTAFLASGPASRCFPSDNLLSAARDSLLDRLTR